MLKIVPPKSKKLPIVFVDQESMQSLLTKVCFPKGFIGERDKLIIELFYLTGIRLSELVNIKIKHISFDSYYVKVLVREIRKELYLFQVK